MVPKPLTSSKRLFGRNSRSFGMVILFRQMRQDNILGSSIIVAGEEFRESLIRKMANAAHNPLLHRPRIVTRPQHLDVVI